MIGLAIFHNFPKIGQLQTRNIHIRRKTREIETTAKCQMELHKLSSRDYARSFTIPLPSSFLSFEALLGDRHLFTFVIHTLSLSLSLLSVAVSLSLSLSSLLGRQASVCHRGKAGPRFPFLLSAKRIVTILEGGEFVQGFLT